MTDTTPETVSTRAALLREAETLICGDRNASYGEPTQDFTRTAALWSAYKGVPFEAHEVATFLILLKCSRIAWSPDKHDHWVDIAGYAACGRECRDTAKVSIQEYAEQRKRILAQGVDVPPLDC